MDKLYIDAKKLEKQFSAIGLSTSQIRETIEIIQMNLPLKVFVDSADIEIGSQVKIKVCSRNTFFAQIDGIEPSRIIELSIPTLNAAKKEQEPIELSLKLCLDIEFKGEKSLLMSKQP